MEQEAEGTGVGGARSGQDSCKGRTDISWGGGWLGEGSAEVAWSTKVQTSLPQHSCQAWKGLQRISAFLGSPSELVVEEGLEPSS